MGNVSVLEQLYSQLYRKVNHDKLQKKMSMPSLEKDTFMTLISQYGPPWKGYKKLSALLIRTLEVHVRLSESRDFHNCLHKSVIKESRDCSNLYPTKNLFCGFKDL